MVYGVPPQVPLDLARFPPPIPISASAEDFASGMVALHNQVKRRLTTAYAGYASQGDGHYRCVVLEPCNLVSVYI